jgi:integrase
LVPISSWLADELAGVIAGKAPDDFVFTTWHGKPLRNLNFRRDVFNRAAVDAGLGQWIDGPTRPLYRGVSPHELRHTAASLAAKEGAKVSAVQKMLGHASAKMTLDTYTHLFDDELEGVAERFAAPPARHQTGTKSAEADVIDLGKRRTTRPNS